VTAEQRLEQLQRENAELRQRVLHLETIMTVTRMVIGQAWEDRVSPRVS